MKRVLLLCFTLVVALSGVAAPKGDKSIKMRVGTYNLWSDGARQWKINRNEAPATRTWELSKEAVADVVVKVGCDLMAFQEVTSVCRDDMRELIAKSGAKHYKIWWMNSYPDGHKTVVGNSLLYNSQLFKLSNKRIFYISPTPTVVSTGWGEHRHYRTALAATVLHKPTGRRFFLVCTHGPLNREASSHYADVLIQIDKEFNPEKLPTIVMGDMNAWPGQPFLDTMKTQYKDCYDEAAVRGSEIGTYASSKELETHFAAPRRRIDHIYFHSTDKGSFEVHSYKVNRDKYPIGGKMHYPSDHNPVYVDMTLK